MSITLDIPENVLGSIPGSSAEVEARLRLELACALYRAELASFGSAAEIAGLHPFLFGHELARHGISRHYGDDEMADDDAYVACRQGAIPSAREAILQLRVEAGFFVSDEVESNTLRLAGELKLD